MCDLDEDRDLSLEPIKVPCPSCGGDGGFDVPHDIDRRDGSLLTHWSECRTCGGTGDDYLEVLPLEEEDLEQLQREINEAEAKEYCP
jgi:hypothetical protein